MAFPSLRATFVAGFVWLTLTTLASDAFAKTIAVPGDFPAIQAAIDAAETGDTVLVKAGVYRERIKLKAGVTLKSDGNDTRGERGLARAEGTILDGKELEGEGSAVTMAADAVLDGFTIRNFGHYDEAEWQRNYDTQGNLQSHEHIGASPAPGISIPDVTCVVKHNLVHHIGDTGIGAFGSADSMAKPHIYRNVCYRNMGGGIGAMRQTKATIEENDCFENFYAGIGHNHASPMVINNTCYANIRAGIGISEGSSPTVKGNRCYKNRRAGIGVRTEATTKPMIEGNECYDNDMAGIGAEEDAAPTIVKNKCYRNKLAGIGVRHATAEIRENECYENGAAGIGLDNASGKLIANYVHENKTAGLGFANSDKGEALVVKNRVIDNKQVAIGVHSGWNVTMVENEISRAGGMPPLVMIFADSKVMMGGDKLTGGGVAGVRVEGEVRIDRCELNGTQFRKVGPPNFAVWALPGSKVELIGNTFDNWRHALVAQECEISAVENQVKRFHQTAFVLQNMTAKSEVLRNQVFTGDAKAQVVKVNGAEKFPVVEEENEIRAEDGKK
ncbi:right-handed parallel beta-helix repeat-containing protein [Blastopirellula sp. JC732]|uniref:Right-handed parallel beta-helix repeat-containing protein n=1 Tax=Blastopirellula sediminis TaxID=2894196 RepID=A0A9X1MQH5_9BACT|nr:right-handed parallel beta-helix repeat-containing protein [Blastopirellula sediminis]MCC9605092.1 right-handed parallel beta-helix repeat-containing protein [Blastopirellula sediminis]MCC9631608.1 right-handed parallel beta-helix repeat-containing protein [Blastopirellula sediminis]